MGISASNHRKPLFVKPWLHKQAVMNSAGVFTKGSRFYMVCQVNKREGTDAFH